MELLRSWMIGTAILLLPTQGFAFNLDNRSWNGATAQFHFDIRLAGNPTSASGITWNFAFMTAMQRWNSSTPFEFTSGDIAEQDPCIDDGKSSASFQDSLCGTQFGSSTLAVSRLLFMSNGKFIESDIVFNQNFDWDVLSGNINNSKEDLTRIAVHELGHSLGLGHEDNVQAIMSSLDDGKEFPTSDDIAGVNAIYNTFIFSSVLPASRSVQVGSSATVFATIVNAGETTARGCSITNASILPVSVSYQATDPLTNQPMGLVDAPIDITANESQTFIVTTTTSESFASTDMRLNYRCDNRPSADTITGLNTLKILASETPVSDVVALAASTIPGVVAPSINGTGVFAVASVNVGVSGDVLVTADTGGVNLPIELMLCETDPNSGTCINPTTPTSNPVATEILDGATPTFGIFVSATSLVPFSPAVNRVFVRFKTTSGTTVGSTSVAIRTN